jgi:hypothetical protein
VRQEVDRAPRIFDRFGEPLDAQFHLELRSFGVDLIFAAQGGASGTRRAQNPDYIRALETLLERLKDLDAVLRDAIVDSAQTQHLSLDARRIPITGGYPLDLATVSDPAALRREMRRHVSQIGRKPSSTRRDGGNGNRKLRLSLGISVAVPVLDTLLRGTPSAGQLDNSLMSQTWRSWSTAPPVLRERLSRYVERGPNADKVKKENAYRCQVCDAQGIAWEPFRKTDGVPYVEAHHVVLVSTLEEDVLSPRNIITVCPNHHRQIHFGGAVIEDLGDAFGIWFPGAPQFKITKFHSDNS